MAGTNRSWNSEKTRKLVIVAMLTAILLVLQFTPLGYLPIPGLNPTLMHIPVIIGAILLGPGEGAFLGLMFGVTSIIQAMIQAPVTAFIFNPFVPGGSYKSVIVAVVPRVLVGVVAAYAFRLVSRIDKTQVFASLTACILGSLTNTLLVLGGIYLFFRNGFAGAYKIPASTVFHVLLGVVTTSGIAEAAAAALIGTAVCKALFVVTKKSRLRKA